MSQKMNPSKIEVAPFEYFSSTLGNAFFSGMSMEMLFECVCETHDESKNAFNPQIRVEIQQAKRLDTTVSVALWAKERLEKIVGEHGDT